MKGSRIRHRNIVTVSSYISDGLVLGKTNFNFLLGIIIVILLRVVDLGVGIGIVIRVQWWYSIRTKVIIIIIIIICSIITLCNYQNHSSSILYIQYRV